MINRKRTTPKDPDDDFASFEFCSPEHRPCPEKTDQILIHTSGMEERKVKQKLRLLSLTTMAVDWPTPWRWTGFLLLLSSAHLMTKSVFGLTDCTTCFCKVGAPIDFFVERKPESVMTHMAQLGLFALLNF